MSRHDASLRKFRFEDILNFTPGLLNVSQLRNLRYLAALVDALVNYDHEELSMQWNCVDKQTFNVNRHGFSSVHDIEDMWAETMPASSKAVDQDHEEQSITRSILAGTDVPLPQPATRYTTTSEVTGRYLY